jgi:hypothetical protein
MAKSMLFFLKAAIKGGAGADLFATPVVVKPYVTKEGTPVGAHVAIRHKRPEEHAAPPAPKSAEPDLFSAAAAKPAPQPARRPNLFGAPPAVPKPTAAPPEPKAQPRPPAPSPAPAEQTDPEFFAKEEAKIAKRKAEAASLAAAGKPVKLTHGRGMQALVGPDMSDPGMFRITRFDAAGPIGHTQYRTFDDALNDALAEGFAPDEAAPPTPARPDKPTYPWGVPAGTKASERVRLNAAAVALL